MNRAQLVPCRSCARHVRATDSACPFCGSAVQARPRAFATPQVPHAHLSRAALFALGAAAAAATAGCSGQVSPLDGGGDAAVVDGGVADGAVADAGPAQDAARDAPPDVIMMDAGNDVNIQPPYGTPPPPDDAGTKMMYGGPPP